MTHTIQLPNGTALALGYASYAAALSTAQSLLAIGAAKRLFIAPPAGPRQPVTLESPASVQQ